MTLCTYIARETSFLVEERKKSMWISGRNKFFCKWIIFTYCTYFALAPFIFLFFFHLMYIVSFGVPTDSMAKMKTTCFLSRIIIIVTLAFHRKNVGICHVMVLELTFLLSFGFVFTLQKKCFAFLLFFVVYITITLTNIDFILLTVHECREKREAHTKGKKPKNRLFVCLSSVI